MRRVKTSVACVVLMGVLVSLAGPGCAPNHGAAPNSSALKTSWTAPKAAIGSFWRYHPRKAATIRSTLALGTVTLFAGDRGERWQLGLSANDARPAAMLAPESLIDIVQPSAESWWFVGASGAVYEAKTPLGEFVRSTAPAMPLAQVAAAPTVLLGVTQRGALMVSHNGGVAWEPLPKTQGHEFVDVAIDASGRALALEVPERLWFAELPELKFAPLAGPSVGALSLENPQGDLKITGLFEDYTLNAERALTAVKPTSQLGTVKLKLPLGPDAAALLQGRASLTNGFYAEARAGEKGWDWVSGKLGESLKLRRLPGTAECKLVKLSAFADSIYFACGASSGASTQELVLYRSRDAGLHFEREPYLLRGSAYALRLAAGPREQLLITGVCDLGDGGTSCQPGGIFVADPEARAKKTRRRFRRVLAPGLKGPAQALGFFADGKRAYAVGTRDKGNHHALYLSRDGGFSFDTNLFEARNDGAPPSDPVRPRAEALGTALHAASGPDGTLAVTYEGSGKQTAIFFDPAGQMTARATPPETARFLAAAGSSAVAWSDITGHAYLSQDAGASWTNLGALPAALCEAGQRCAPSIACEASGCVFGDVLTHVGWSLPLEAPRPLLNAPEAQIPRRQRRVRRPISCELGTERWLPLEGAAYAPSASDAAIGEVDWMLPSLRPKERAVDMLHQRGEKLERLPIFPKVAAPERFAFNVFSQIEGVAAIRYPLATPEQPRLANIEVAWANYFTPQIVQRALLPDAGPYLPGDYKQSESDATLQQADPDLVSIAEGGIFVRPHKSPGNQQITYYLHGRSIEKIPAVDWPKNALAARLAPEMAVIGGEYVPLLLENDGALVVRARPRANGFEFSAISTGLLSPESSQLLQRRSVVYLDGAAALYVHREDAFGTFSQANVFPFQAVGAPVGQAVRVPTQLDTSDPPVGCSGAVRKTTPRTVSILTGGTRHPVLITEGSEPLRTLLTTNAVLYGTLANPCVAVFDAQPIKETPGRTPGERALVSVSEDGRSWLFRQRALEGESTAQIEYKRMRCQFDASLEVPEEVFEAVGTTAAPASQTDAAGP